FPTLRSSDLQRDIPLGNSQRCPLTESFLSAAIQRRIEPASCAPPRRRGAVLSNLSGVAPTPLVDGHSQSPKVHGTSHRPSPLEGVGTNLSGVDHACTDSDTSGFVDEDE